MGKKVAIVGITGVVGEEMLNCLEKRNFPVDELRVMASARSAGKKVKFKGEELTVIEAKEDSFKGIDIALFAIEADQSKLFAPAAVKAGALVIDNSSAFRMDPECPLVVPEINPEAAKKAPKGIIANPNCSTIIMNVPVFPLHKVNPVKRLVVSTYQAASGAGRPAMEELAANAKAWAEGKPFTPKVFPYPLFMNVFSHNASIGADGYNGEEVKMIQETRKIFSAPEIRLTATCVRVPVLRAHCESINIEFTNPMPEKQVYDILSSAKGVRILDDRKTNRSPQPADATGQGDILVGRIRQDASQPDCRGIDMFVSGDQILKGAALNAVQIAEIV